MEFYSRYEAPYYAVFRTSAQRFIFGQAQEITNAMLLETFHSAAVVMEGKLKRLNEIYYLRNLGIPHHARPIEGWNQWMALDFDDFFDHYRLHRAKIIEVFASRGNIKIDPQKMRRALDMSFIIYLGREFHMGYWVDEYLSTAVVDQKEKNRLRQKMNTSLLAINSFHDSLGRAIKHSIKSFIKGTLGEKGFKFRIADYLSGSDQFFRDGTVGAKSFNSSSPRAGDGVSRRRLEHPRSTDDSRLILLRP